MQTQEWMSLAKDRNVNALLSVVFRDRSNTRLSEQLLGHVYADKFKFERLNKIDFFVDINQRLVELNITDETFSS